jgi:P4 family phage/plasmid primase-like protien
MTANVIDLEARRRAMNAPVLPDTSHEAIQRYVMDKIAESGAALYSEGQWWQFGALGAWVDLPEERIWHEVQALNGIDTLEGAHDDRPGKAIRVSAGMCESVCALARARFAAHDGFASATHGFVSPAGLWTYNRGDGWTVRPATPDDRVRLLVAVDPDLAAVPERWLSVLQRIWTTTVADDAYEDAARVAAAREDAAADLAERVAFIHEWIAVVLLSEATQHQVAPILVGDGENGKSVILDVIASLVPPALRCSVTPHDLEASPFASAALVGKALNCVAEIPSTELLSSARIKAVIDGSEQRGERKHKDSFIFRPIAGNIFSANGLPPSRDRSHGFWRRWQLLTSPGPKVSEAEKVRGLAALIAEAETAAILGYAMRYHDQRENEGRGLTKPRSSLAETQRWRVESDNVSQWIEDNCTRTGETSFSALYSDYRTWCTSNGCQALSSKQWGNRLTALELPTIERRDSKRRGLTLQVKP